MTSPPPNWQCSSAGTRNNDLVKECKFVFYFDPRDIQAPNCPVCGALMKVIESPNSVSRILRRGFEAEQRNKNKT